MEDKAHTAAVAPLSSAVKRHRQLTTSYGGGHESIFPCGGIGITCWSFWNRSRCCGITERTEQLSGDQTGRRAVRERISFRRDPGHLCISARGARVCGFRWGTGDKSALDSKGTRQLGSRWQATGRFRAASSSLSERLWRHWNSTQLLGIPDAGLLEDHGQGR